VFVGRFDHRKRVHEFIQAACELGSHTTPSLFLVVGGPDAFQPDYALQLQQQARALFDAHRLVFTGPRSDVPGILCAADILVLPSTGEGMAHVISEAGAAGLAVVASDDGAAREQLDDGNCGILFSPGDTTQLTEALRRLIDDRPLRQRLGRILKERVNARYAAHVVIHQWNSVLEETIREMDESFR
jgi:glycosyltransferase involved in cell wall biosynthesis